MKRSALVCLIVLLALGLSACGPEVPEELLPTPIPELTMDYFYADAAEEAVAEAAPAEEAAVEQAVVEEASAEEAAADEAVADEAPAEEAAAEDAVAEEAPAEEAAADEAVAAEAPAEEAAVEDAVADEAPAEEAAVEDAVADEAPAEEAAAEDAVADEAPAEEAAVEDAVAEEAVAEEASAEEAPAAETDATGSLLPPEFVAALDAADPSRGEQLSLQNACIGCHNLDPNVQMAGPTWHNMAETAATRVDGQSAEEYLYNSIVNPNDYVVEGYAQGIMLQNYGQTLSQQDIADMVAYLLTLRGE